MVIRETTSRESVAQSFLSGFIAPLFSHLFSYFHCATFKIKDKKIWFWIDGTNDQARNDAWSENIDLPKVTHLENMPNVEEFSTSDSWLMVFVTGGIEFPRNKITSRLSCLMKKVFSFPACHSNVPVAHCRVM